MSWYEKINYIEFSTNQPEPKCTNPSSRQSAYKLISAFSYYNYSFTENLMKVLDTHHR